MQSQNTPQFLIKSFKRHYRKVKDVADLLAASHGSFSFTYSYKQGNLQTTLETPNEEATLRFVVLMRRFLNPASILYYKHVWNTLKEHFPATIPAEEVLQFEQFISKLNKGAVSFVVNQQEITAENIYHIVANDEYFGQSDNGAVAFLRSIADLPVGSWLL